MYEYITTIETLLDYYPESEYRVDELIGLSKICGKLTRDVVESDVCILGRENVIRLKRFKEALDGRKNRWMLIREDLLSDLPGRDDYPLPEKCPGQRTQRSYEGYWGLIAYQYKYLIDRDYEPGTIIHYPDPYRGEDVETDDIKGLISSYEKYFAEHGVKPEEWFTEETLYTFREDAGEMLAEFCVTVETIDNAIQKYLGEIHYQGGLLFDVAIYKIARIVNKAGIFGDPLTPDDLLQVLNVNPRYSGIRFVENKKSWVISFIYLLANFYKEFEEQNSDLWAKRIVPFLGIDYSNEYLKRKKQKEKSISDGYKDFMVQLEDCLDRYNLLLKFGYDNNSRDSFMEQFSTMG